LPFARSENRLTFRAVVGVTTNFAYNDGARVKKVANGVTTYYVGNLYEYTTWNGGSSVSKYYYFGGQRIAVKQDINVSYIHGDHLGSTNKTTGASSSTQTYYPYGAIKTSSGTPPTDYGYTGQKRDATANLMFYNARYYDPALARFIQPDTIVPNPMDPQSLNRYSYVRNNPVNRIDPTGHEDCAAEDDWCWQNRWYEAHGYCWSDTKQDWAKQCTPEFQDEDILKEVIREGGEAPSEILQRLLDATHNGKFKFVLPNVFVLGFQVQGGYGGYAAGFAQIVFDYKHNQIGWFFGGELGGLVPTGAGISVSFGIGWGGSAFTSVGSYSRWAIGGGLSGTAPVAGAIGVGVGTDVLVSADDSFVGDTWKLTPNPDNLLLVQPSLSLGTAGGEVHWYAAYSIEGPVTPYGNDTAMAFGTYTTVYAITHDSGFSFLMASYAFQIQEYPIGQ
jgi:RHS repeat-associated protein